MLQCATLPNCPTPHGGRIAKLDAVAAGLQSDESHLDVKALLHQIVDGFWLCCVGPSNLLHRIDRASSSIIPATERRRELRSLPQLYDHGTVTLGRGIPHRRVLDNWLRLGLSGSFGRAFLCDRCEVERAGRISVSPGRWNVDLETPRAVSPNACLHRYSESIVMWTPGPLPPVGPPWRATPIPNV